MGNNSISYYQHQRSCGPLGYGHDPLRTLDLGPPDQAPPAADIWDQHWRPIQTCLLKNSPRATSGGGH